jgi:hypothetical protein
VVAIGGGMKTEKNLHLPRNYCELLDAGYTSGNDFLVTSENVDLERSWLIAAPPRRRL